MNDELVKLVLRELDTTEPSGKTKKVNFYEFERKLGLSKEEYEQFIISLWKDKHYIWLDYAVGKPYGDMEMFLAVNGLAYVRFGW